MTKKQAIILISIFVVILCLVLYSVSNKNEQAIIYNVETFKSGDGWGYQICQNGGVIIYQSFVPCIENNKPFPDEESAMNTGKLVLSKVKNQENPSVTIEELSSIFDVNG